jgi:hypothetical protein
MWKAQLPAVFDAHDVLISPTTPMTAPMNGETHRSPRRPPCRDWAGHGEVHRAMESDGHADSCCADILRFQRYARIDSNHRETRR